MRSSGETKLSDLGVVLMLVELVIEFAIFFGVSTLGGVWLCRAKPPRFWCGGVVCAFAASAAFCASSIFCAIIWDKSA